MDKVQAVSVVDTGNIVVQWIPAKEEWKRFNEWERRSGFWSLFYFIVPVLPQALRITDEIIITTTGVFINGRFNAFKNEFCQLVRIEILEDVNPKVMEITCRQKTGNRIRINTIRIPIPRGRLGRRYD